MATEREKGTVKGRKIQPDNMERLAVPQGLIEYVKYEDAAQFRCTF